MEAAHISIDSVEDALAYLTYLKYGDQHNESVKIGGELAVFGASIQGQNYHGTVPAALARGLWEFQEELYRAVAFALYGGENYKRLTDEQKAQFELVFEVREGSSEILATLTGFFDKLGEGFQNMDSGHKMQTLVAIALIFGAGWGYQSYAEQQTKIAEIGAESAEKEGFRTMLATQQEHLQIIAEIVKGDPSAARFGKAVENGTKAIIKGASDADHIRINRANFNRDDIVEVNQRAAKEAAQANIVIDEYRVVRGDARDGGLTRFWLLHKDGAEFSGIIVDEDFDAKGLNHLWEAFRGRGSVKLELNITSVRGQIRSASILRVIE
jgi:hypothetical protein